METQVEEKKLSCDMKCSCKEPITHIDNKGFIYCQSHGEQRKYSVPCRKLTKKELETLKSGQPIKSY